MSRVTPSTSSAVGPAASRRRTRGRSRPRWAATYPIAWYRDGAGGHLPAIAFRAQRALYRRRVTRGERMCGGRPGRVLDVGCGSGLRLGAAAAGVSPPRLALRGHRADGAPPPGEPLRRDRPLARPRAPARSGRRARGGHASPSPGWHRDGWCPELRESGGAPDARGLLSPCRAPALEPLHVPDDRAPGSRRRPPHPACLLPCPGIAAFA
jgi:hypothetical protein